MFRIIVLLANLIHTTLSHSLICSDFNLKQVKHHHICKFSIMIIIRTACSHKLSINFKVWLIHVSDFLQQLNFGVTYLLTLFASDWWSWFGIFRHTLTIQLCSHTIRKPVIVYHTLQKVNMVNLIFAQLFQKCQSLVSWVQVMENFGNSFDIFCVKNCHGWCQTAHSFMYLSDEKHNIICNSTLTDNQGTKDKNKLLLLLHLIKEVKQLESVFFCCAVYT